MTINPVTRLTELEAARDTARQAEADARDEHTRRQRAVPEAREALTRAHHAGAGVKAAEEAYEKAQKAAADGALSARVDGLARATRSADIEVLQHLERHFADLVAAYQPRAEAAVVTIAECAAALRDALDEWHRVGVEVGQLGRHLQWFVPHQRIPASPFDKLRAALDQLGEVPLPMPDSTTNPVEEAERLRVADDRVVAA